jgi:hypothetical protein
MKSSNFKKRFQVNQTPKEVFSAVNNVKSWWSELIEGDTQKVGDIFIYRHKDLHYSMQKLIEVIPNKKVVWEVLDSQLNFLKNKNEWTGTTISFDITKNENGTELLFIHHGLVPEIECFEACSNGWNYYLEGSLLRLIQNGKGQPDK